MDLGPRYELIDAGHGEGGFGTVAKYRDLFLERCVAIKTMSVGDEDSKQRFTQEARTLARLSHPNVPALYDVVFKDDAMAIIFEFVEGVDLDSLIEEEELPSIESCRRWFEQILSALEYAHARGIIHRDVKPGNIVVTQDRRSAYLVDFGLALVPHDAFHEADLGYAIGTEGYMSPEQEDGLELDATSDLYSLAVTLYETLSGNLPEAEAYHPLAADNEAIPPAVDELIRRCLNKERRYRLRSATEVRAALRGAFRTDLPFSTLLTGARLHELIAGLGSMSREEFASKPRGQKLLIYKRVKELLRNQRPSQARSTARLIAQLLRLSLNEPEETCQWLSELAFSWGFEKTFGERQGDQDVREALIDAAKIAESPALDCLAASFEDFVDVYALRSKPAWYAHDLRHIVTALLVNPACGDAADSLADLYESINEKAPRR